MHPVPDMIRHRTHWIHKKWNPFEQMLKRKERQSEELQKENA
jgi:hypothetical protein